MVPTMSPSLLHSKGDNAILIPLLSLRRFHHRELCLCNPYFLHNIPEAQSEHEKD